MVHKEEESCSSKVIVMIAARRVGSDIVGYL
jgi:hypothetical protein